MIVWGALSAFRCHPPPKDSPGFNVNLIPNLWEALRGSATLGSMHLKGEAGEGARIDILEGCCPSRGGGWERRGQNSNSGDMSKSIPHVLIVDDSQLEGYMLANVLRKEGFEVSTALSGREGLALALETQPDIILMDVIMAGLNGFETCDLLKRDGRTSSIPVIFLSGVDDRGSRVRGLNGGGVDYINKPFEREETLARLRIHLRIRAAFEALVEKERAQLSTLREAQKSILVQPHELPEARFAIHYRPLLEAGGDFYDVIQLGELIHGYFLADVGGHDLGAAFITSALKALLRQNFTALYTPAEIMTLLNSVIVPVLPEGTFLSACCARLNRRTRQMTYVIAGNPPLLLLSAAGETRLLEAEGDLLGAFEAPFFESREVTLKPGDRLLFLTDGLIEEFQGRVVRRAEGIQNLLRAAETARGLALSAWVAAVAGEICPPGQPAADDLLLLGVEI